MPRTVAAEPVPLPLPPSDSEDPFGVPTIRVGIVDGANVCGLVGDTVGCEEGNVDGEPAGELEGVMVGDAKGCWEGNTDGEMVGELEGGMVGDTVGDTVGGTVQ